MVDFFLTSSKLFTGVELGLFLEKLHWCYMKEYRQIIKKGKEQKFILQKESEVKAELEEKLNLFLEEIVKIISVGDKLSLRDLVLTFFEIMYRFRKDIPKEFSDEIFEKAKNIDNFVNFQSLDLIKLSYILSRYSMALNTLENAQIGLFNITQILSEPVTNESENTNAGSSMLPILTKEEILTLVQNLSYRGVYPELEFFTKLEPYILKYLNKYTVESLISIYCSYIRNFLGTNFFLQTVGFSINSNLHTCEAKHLISLLEVSAKKYYNREELDLKFSELFLNVFNLLTPAINILKPIDINIIIKGMINSSYNDKKFLHLLSTVYLKYAEREEFKNLTYMMYYFALCDLENVIFYKKTLEVLSLNFICLQNYLTGNEDVYSFEGIYDKPTLKKLEDVYMKNVEIIKDKLRSFERIQYNSDEIFSTLDMLCKMVWTVTFYLSKLKDIKPEDVKQFLAGIIQVFNNFVSNLKNSEEAGIEIKILKANIDKISLAYVYLLINSEKFSIKRNLNIEFLKLNTLIQIEHKDEVYDYDKFNQFKEKVCHFLQNQNNIAEIKYEEDFSDISNYKIDKFLKVDFVRKIDNDGDNDSVEIIFINNPYDFFEVSMNHTGFNRLRRHLCNSLQLKFREIDYHEFLIFYKDFEINEENLPKLVEEFLELKLNTDY